MRQAYETSCLAHRTLMVAVVFLGVKVREVVSKEALGQWQPAATDLTSWVRKIEL